MSVGNILSLVKCAKDAVTGKAMVTDLEGKLRKQSDVLIDIGQQHELFHGKDSTAYARVGVAVYVIDSTSYREVLAERFLQLTNKGANRNSLGDAITTLSSIAKHRGDQREIFLRTGRQGDSIVLDPGRRDWRMIEVTAQGWQWCESPPMFRRTKAMLELPEPKIADFNRIWQYLNVSKEHRVLVAAWLLSTLHPTGPYPILFLSGEQGTGKSTAARAMRRLIDPSASLLRAPPKDTRDLLVGALCGWVLALDNLSYLGPELSDALCRISTGGAISERTLYTNAEETLIEVQRPCIVNGIEDLATRPDLAERGLHVELDLIERRRTESEFWQAFDEDAPHILGALLAACSVAIRDHKKVRVDRLPRMADFALWSVAGLPALGFDPNEFLDAYGENQESGLSAGVDTSPVGRVLVGFIRNENKWTGSATDLLAALNKVGDESATRSPAWPKSPSRLSNTIRRLAPALRQQGIMVKKGRIGSARSIRLCSRPGQSSQPSSASRPGDDDDENDANDSSFLDLHNESEIEL